jgi:nitrite reductase/ring-hydroxylating ferredoxin subunit
MNQVATSALGYPEGWFCVGEARELRAGQVRTVPFFGRELLLFRGQGGRAVAVDPYCPHLGAHMGHGGEVRGEHLRCPFHGFEFDHEGTCRATGYGTTPPRDARLETFPLVERAGFLLVWYSPAGRSPLWDVPEPPGGDFTSSLTRTWTLNAHPQETTENSVDIGHLSVVHGYSDLETLSPLRTEGPWLTTRYAMQRAAGVFGRAGEKLRAEFEIHAWGLGWSFVDVHVPAYGLHLHHFVLVTPIDATRSTLRIGLRIDRMEDPSRMHAALGLLPRTIVQRIVHRAAFQGYAHDVSQDFDIWQHKIYVERPVLATGDGPVFRYRRWARQFYPAAGEPGGLAADDATALEPVPSS